MSLWTIPAFVRSLTQMRLIRFSGLTAMDRTVRTIKRRETIPVRLWWNARLLPPSSPKVDTQICINFVELPLATVIGDNIHVIRGGGLERIFRYPGGQCIVLLNMKWSEHHRRGYEIESKVAYYAKIGSENRIFILKNYVYWAIIYSFNLQTHLCINLLWY